MLLIFVEIDKMGNCVGGKDKGASSNLEKKKPPTKSEDSKKGNKENEKPAASAVTSSIPKK